MFANYAGISAIDQPQQRQSNDVNIIDLSNEREYVGNEIQRRDTVNDSGKEQSRIGSRHPRILQHSAEKHDHVWQKHQEVLHTAFYAAPLVARDPFLSSFEFVHSCSSKSRNCGLLVQVYGPNVVW